MQIKINVFNQLGAAVTGGAANTSLSFIQDKTSNPQFMYDFNDNTFKASTTPPTTPTVAMAEVDAIRLAGKYNYFQDVSAWDDGWYEAHARYYSAGVLESHFYHGFYVKDGLEITQRAANNEPVYPTFTVQADAGNNGSTFKTNLASTTDDYYRDMLCSPITGVLAASGDQIKKTVTYNGTTKFITMSTPFTSTPAAGVIMELLNR